MFSGYSMVKVWKIFYTLDVNADNLAHLITYETFYCENLTLKRYVGSGSVTSIDGDESITGTDDGHHNQLQQPEGVSETPTESAAFEVESKLEFESVTNLEKSKLKSMEISEVETSAEVKHSMNWWTKYSFVFNSVTLNT